MLSKNKKQKVIKQYQTHEGDTGSSEVQIALLTAEINELSGHLKMHHKDHSSRRGLLRKVGERRRLLRYLKKENLASYDKLVTDLKLKQAKEVAARKAAEKAAKELEIAEQKAAEKKAEEKKAAEAEKKKNATSNK